MKERSLKLNFILNNIRIILNFLTPLITFPYTSRVLGPVSIGKVDFANSIVSYFILFASLGIPSYGIRAVAASRDNKEELSKTVAELSVISIFMSFFMTLIYLAFVFLGNINVEKKLFFILLPQIFLTTLSFEWFYTGVEDQLYITIRFIFVKFISIIALFMFIKSSDDYLMYAFISFVLTAASSVFNIIRLRKYISFVSFRKLELKPHIKPILIIFGSSIAISLYSHLDSTMIGFFAGEEAVGLYSCANRLINMILSIVTSLGVIMMPRLANLLEKNEIERYKNNLSKSLNFIFLFSLPIIWGILSVGTEFILLFAGEKYLASGTTFLILSPILFIIASAHFIGIQILYTNKLERIYTIAVSIGAMANIIANFFLIPRLQQNGAAIGSLIAEGTGLIVMSILGRKTIKKFVVFDWRIIGFFIASVLMFICLNIFKYYFDLYVLIYVFVGIFLYSIFVVIWLKVCKTNILFFIKNFQFQIRGDL